MAPFFPIENVYSAAKIGKKKLKNYICNYFLYYTKQTNINNSYYTFILKQYFIL